MSELDYFQYFPRQWNVIYIPPTQLSGRHSWAPSAPSFLLPIILLDTYVLLSVAAALMFRLRSLLGSCLHCKEEFLCATVGLLVCLYKAWRTGHLNASSQIAHKVTLVIFAEMKKEVVNPPGEQKSQAVWRVSCSYFLMKWNELLVLQ